MKRTGAKGKQTVTTSQLQDGLREALDRVQFGGETLYVTRWDRPAAKLTPLSAADLAKLEEVA